jgi:hypothetical protein
MKELDYSWVWPAISQLFTEHGFLTVICCLLIVSLTIRFYQFLRRIHPMMVPFTMLFAFCILVFHWTQTRTEPRVLTPAVDFLVSFMPMPTYQGQKLGQPGTAKTAPGKAAPGKAAPAKAVPGKTPVTPAGK